MNSSGTLQINDAAVGATFHRILDKPLNHFPNSTPCVVVALLRSMNSKTLRVFSHQAPACKRDYYLQRL